MLDCRGLVNVALRVCLIAIAKINMACRDIAMNMNHAILMVITCIVAMIIQITITLGTIMVKKNMHMKVVHGLI